MTPLSVLLSIMSASFQSGDLATARICAEAAAPFCHSRMSSAAPETQLPPELTPDGPGAGDPQPTPDEPGPANPIT